VISVCYIDFIYDVNGEINNNNNNNKIYFNSIFIYLLANWTAQRPIKKRVQAKKKKQNTKTRQFIYIYNNNNNNNFITRIKVIIKKWGNKIIHLQWIYLVF
jgi:hypothetical protein